MNMTLSYGLVPIVCCDPGLLFHRIDKKIPLKVVCPDLTQMENTRQLFFKQFSAVIDDGVLSIYEVRRTAKDLSNLVC